MKNLLKVLLPAILGFTSLSAQNNTFFANYSVNWKLAEQLPNAYMLFGSFSNTLVWISIDSTGSIQNHKTYLGLTLSDAKLLPGNAIIATGTQSLDSFFLAKFDPTGNMLWSKGYSFPGYGAIKDLHIMPSKYHGGFWINGSGYKGHGNWQRGFILKTDSMGVVQLSKEINTDSAAGYTYNSGGPILEENNNSIYFTTTTIPFECPDEMLVLKTDSLLNEKWAKAFSWGDPGDIIKAGNNINILWSTPYNNGLIMTAATLNLTKFDTAALSSTSLMLQQIWFGTGNSISSTKDGGFVFSGITGRNRYSNSEGVSVKVDSSWRIQWAQEYGFLNASLDNAGINHIIPTRDGGYLMAGYYLIKTDSAGNSGCNDSTLIYKDSTITYPPKNISISISPLAFNSFTNIPVPVSKIYASTFTCYKVTGMEPLPSAHENINISPNPSHGQFKVLLQNITSPLCIDIYNVLGESIYHSTLKSTESDISLNVSPGIYIYRILSGNNTLISTGKLAIN